MAYIKVYRSKYGDQGSIDSLLDFTRCRKEREERGDCNSRFSELSEWVTDGVISSVKDHDRIHQCTRRDVS